VMPWQIFSIVRLFIKTQKLKKKFR
jgi:hypothetical protein